MKHHEMIYSNRAGRLSMMMAFFICLICGWTVQGGVVINEIHYNPDVKTEPADFVELFNTDAVPVDLSGWQFSDGILYTFPFGTSLKANGYLVVAQNPAFIAQKFKVTALGPFTGGLSKYGEKVVLKDASGRVSDEVDYKSGFPWPTVGDPPGYSIELLNPVMDNNLGGSWRASVAGNPTQSGQTLIPERSSWKYFKGTQEPSSPTTAWRQSGFNDSSWLTGDAPIGYDPSVPLGVNLTDMRNNYTSVYFRKTFAVSDPSQVNSLVLEALYDDGFKVWINGVAVLDVNISSGELPFDGVAGPARESSEFETFNIPSAQSFLLPGQNIIAIQAHNSSLSGSSDFYLDVRLTAQVGPSGSGPTPGRINSVYTTNAPPIIRQVEHHPEQPSGGEPVRVSAKVTDSDGVASVILLYQVVAPGNYIELTDPAYATNWTAVAMRDDGLGGDSVAGDDTYSVELPASIQSHRSLVRYRITATDRTGRAIQVPYADDPQPNFAYFVYDGVPAWQGAARPGATAVQTFSTDVMRRLPVYHLIAKSNTVAQATWFSRYGGDAYLWAGTLIYDGQVYDHVHFRARGGVWRYAMVKNMWKFDMNRGHDFEARDDWGRKYKVPWKKLNLGASIQQGDYEHRGEQGMFESVGFRLFNLVGVESPFTTFVQFRVIDDSAEASPTTQYEGDFWGVYLAIEQEDDRFLEAHDLPDGNFYKMESGTGTPNNIGPLGPTDNSDLNSFLSAYNAGNNGSLPDSWWRTNLNLPKYYSYQAIVQGIHHYDIADGKNYFYFRNPENGQWSVHSWDLDLTWADNMYRGGQQGGDEPFKSRVLANFSSNPPRAALGIEFRNRVREIRDLLFNSDQAFKLIDESAELLRGPSTGPTILDADRAMWDYNPKMANSAYSSTISKAGQGRYYQWRQEPGVSKDFNGAVQLMKNYITYRTTNPTFSLDTMAADAARPNQPSVTYNGPTNYPVNNLTFKCSPFSGNGGAFAALKWRVAEVSDTTVPAYAAGEPRKYEIDAVWESGDIAPFNASITIPADVIKAGHHYRIRALMKDATGRTSNWSPPVEFLAGEPEMAVELANSLRVSEVMYNPPAGSDFEFVELWNTSSSVTLDLNGVRFSQGIDFTFPAGTTLPPGGYLIVTRGSNANDFAQFRAYYGLGPEISIAGPYTGSLSDGGETVTLRTAAGGSDIVSFTYRDGRGWPLAADGAGHSLVPVTDSFNGEGNGSLEYGGNWRASAFINGSPGRADPEPVRNVVLNEIVAHTDFTSEFDSNDWIELYNLTSSSVTFGPGWYLSDDATKLKKWMIPSATTIGGKGWVSFDEITGFHESGTNGFGLNKAGEQVFLSYLPGNSTDRVVDCVSFKAQENDWSLGRYPDGDNFWQALRPRTRDAANAAPPQSVVISEIMYHPPDIGGTNDNALHEFVELWNTGATPMPLFNTNGVWRLNGDVEIDLPANTTLGPGGRLLLVNFSPTNQVAKSEFAAVYHVNENTLVLFGPYDNKLPNSSGRIALEKPQAPDVPGDGISWVIVDEVSYADQPPWPSQSDGTGMSLHRRSLPKAGNDPANWFSATPTPMAGSATLTDTDHDGLPDEWETQFGFNANDPADAQLDADGDGLSNLSEYLAGTHPKDAQSTLKLAAGLGNNGKLAIHFQALPGRSYIVQYRDSLSTGGWGALAEIEPVATATEIELGDSQLPSASQRFYRLVTSGPVQ